MLLVAHRTPLTSSGCARLAAAGATLFEVDVQLSHGGLVVSHFMPLLGLPGWLEYDNRRLRWTPRARRDPSLHQVAEVVPGDREILLDLKERSAVRRLELTRRIAAELLDRPRYRVSGGTARDLDELRGAGFRTWRTIGSRRDLDVVLAEGPLRDEAVSVRHALLTRSTVERLHSIVPTIVAWTVNDLTRARTLVALGVDGLTTDDSSVMIRVGP
jgi:glycerophosphoryl diester phosphodiesterase